mgnify:FL=1
MRIAVVGATGFVGAAVHHVAAQAGHDVVAVRAPRLRTTARGTQPVRRAAEEADDDVAALATDLHRVQVVINGAGLATPGAAMSDELAGANSMLPGVLARAAAEAGVGRLVHASSAAVHGDAPVLDARERPQPVSPYGFTKLWGEQAALALGRRAGLDVVIYRPTSVHGHGRDVTAAVERLARSPLASVAAPGDDPTPQAMVDDVAALALDLATAPEVSAGPVIHPWEGWTTSSFLEHLSGGKAPAQVPRPLARTLLLGAKAAGRMHPGIGAQARRLEMLWFGQRQRY